MEPKRVILDTDPAIGVKYRDLDDGLAILLLLASPEVHLEGITISFGNVKAPLGYDIAKELLRVARARVPVYMGADSKQELGRSNPAIDFLIETVNANPGEISLVAVAPLTNVATAMMLDSRFEKNLKELIIMGGTFSFPFFSWFGEFNFHCDANAASRVIQSQIPKTLITMDVCSQAVFQDRHLTRIQQSYGRVASYLAEHIPQWLDLNKKVFFRKKGFFPWDPIAAAYLMRPSLFDQNPYHLSVAETGFRAGRLLNPVRLDSFDRRKSTVPINVPLRLNGDCFLDFMLERILSL